MLGGRCSECGSTEVHRKYQGLLVKVMPRDHDLFVMTGNIGNPSDGWAYVCTSCGHSAYFIADKPMLADVAASWEKVPVAPDPGTGT